MIRRLFQSLIVLVVVSIASYGLMGLMPGDPIDLMISADPDIKPEDVTRLKALHGLDQPLYARYAAWAGQALQGDFGYSRLFAAP
ncbi:MAG: ABC transporter permease, partial [Gammaproteobacteria bacterium]